MFDQFYGDRTAAITVEVTEPGDDGVLHVRVGGELDRDEAGPLLASVSAAVGRHTVTAVRVDVSALTFLDSGGIHALLDCREAAASAGSSFSLVSPTANVYQVLEVTGLLALFGVTGDVRG